MGNDPYVVKIGATVWENSANNESKKNWQFSFLCEDFIAVPKREKGTDQKKETLLPIKLSWSQIRQKLRIRPFLEIFQAFFSCYTGCNMRLKKKLAVMEQTFFMATKQSNLTLLISLFVDQLWYNYKGEEVWVLVALDFGGMWISRPESCLDVSVLCFCHVIGWGGDWR